MFGIGFPELMLIGIVVLLLFGPQKLPEVMRQIGNFFNQVKKASEDAQTGVDQLLQPKAVAPTKNKIDSHADKND